MRDEEMDDPEVLEEILRNAPTLEELREQTELIEERDFLGEHVVGKQFAEGGLPGDLGYCIGRCKTMTPPRARFAVVGHWSGDGTGFCQECAMILASVKMRMVAKRRREERTHKRNNTAMAIPKSRRRR